MYRFTKLLSIMILTMVTLVGCSAPAKLFLLEPIVDEKSQRTPTKLQAIGMSVITLPEYANSQAIPTRVDNAQVKLSEYYKWAESPDGAITRVLANRIQAFTGAKTLIEPWPRGFEPEVRVEYDFYKLLRDELGGVEVSGQLRLISGDGDDVLAIENFQFIRESNDNKEKDFFSLMSLAINDIARLTTSILLAMEAPE